MITVAIPYSLSVVFRNKVAGLAALGIALVGFGVVRAAIIVSNDWPPASIFSVDPNQ